MLSDGELLSDLLLCSRPAPFVPNTALISTESVESFLELCTELLSHSSVVTLAREWHLSMPSPSLVNPSPKIMLRSSLPRESRLSMMAFLVRIRRFSSRVPNILGICELVAC